MPAQTARTERRRAMASEWWAGAWRWCLMAAATAIVVYLMLDRNIPNGAASAVALAGLVIGAVLTGSRPMAIALMATPALFIIQRAGLGGGLSVSDVALAAGFGTALLLGDRGFSPPLRMLLWGNLVYQFATLFTVIVNPYTANTVEWFHAWLLVSGALIMGWALGKSGYGRTALGLMILATLVIAAGTIFTGVFGYYLRGNFDAVYPTWPWEMHKNAAGTLMSFGVLILYVRPPWAQFPRRAAWAAMAVLAVAIIMTQSRQALIGLIVAVLIVVFRGAKTGHSRWPFLLAIPGVWLIVVTVIDQIESQNEFNSFFQRLDWMRELYALWKLAPIFGHGLRFWYYTPAAPYQPPQAEFEVATSAGVVGLVGFAVMWLIIVIVLWRVDPLYGTLALVAVVSRLVQAQFDLFWVAAQVSVPFAIAGICLGAMARDARPAVEAETAAAGEPDIERPAAAAGRRRGETGKMRPDRIPTGGRAPVT